MQTSTPPSSKPPRPQGEAPPPFDRTRDGVALGVVALASLAIQLPIYDRWISLLDEGAVAQIAVQINQGLAPYDHAVHLAFPGVFYLTAWLYDLFGPSFVLGRVVMIGVFSAFCLVVYALARSVAGRGVALGVALLCVAYRIWAFPHWQMLSYTPLAILLLTASILLLSLDLARARAWLPPAAGLCLGLGVLFKQDATVVSAVVLAPTLLLLYWLREQALAPAFKRTLVFGLAALAPVALLLLAWTPSGRSAEMLYQTIWVPLVAKPMWSPVTGEVPYTPFPPLWPPFSMNEEIRTGGLFAYFPSLLLDMHWRDLLAHPLYRSTPLPELFVRGVYLLPYLLLGFFLVFEVKEALRRGLRETGAPTLRRWLLIAFAVALLASFNRPRDWIHLMILYAPTFLLLGAFLEVAAGAGGTRRRPLVLGLAAALLAGVVAASFALALDARRFYDHPLEHPRSGLRVRENVAQVLVPLLESLDAERGEGDPPALAALPAMPTLNFLTGRPLATRFLTLLPLEEYPDRDDQILAGFADHPRTRFVYSLQRAAIFSRPQDYAPGVFDYLIRTHRLGTGPGELFGGQEPEGLLIARLVPRSEPDERVLDDLAARIDQAEVRGEGLSPFVDRWPFEAKVVTLAPPPPPGKSEVEMRVAPAEPARLRFGVAMNPDGWSGFLPCLLRFTARIDGVPAFEQALDPRRSTDDRHYVWADLPLSAGPHRVVLETTTDNRFCSRQRTAGWVRPRVVADEGSGDDGPGDE